MKFALNLKGGTVDMSEGLEALCKDYFEEGKAQGITEGKAQGIAEGKLQSKKMILQKMEQVLRSNGLSEESIRSICSEIEELE